MELLPGFVSKSDFAQQSVGFRVNLDLNMVLLTGKVTQMLTMPDPHPATYLMRRDNPEAEKKQKSG